MTCCDDKLFGNQIYIPLNKRLLEFGKDSSNPILMEQFSVTKLWIFTFLDKNDTICVDCISKIQIMVNWFEKFGLLKNPINNIKWIFEDDMSNNLICRDMGISKSPTHLLCDSDGKIIDIVTGFPDENWLDSNILPLVKPFNLITE